MLVLHVQKHIKGQGSRKGVGHSKERLLSLETGERTVAKKLWALGNPGLDVEWSHYEDLGWGVY